MNGPASDQPRRSALDISERKDAYLVTVRAARVEADDLEITLEDGLLTNGFAGATTVSAIGAFPLGASTLPSSHTAVADLVRAAAAAARPGAAR